MPTTRILLFDNSPYMKAWESVASDGTVTTFVQTGEAALVLPYQEKGGSISVFLLDQERSELKGRHILKAPGGYLRSGGETPADCALRNLHRKLGIRASVTDLVPAGSMVGYPTVVISVRLYLLPQWEKVAESAEGCRLVEVPIGEAVDLALCGAIGDDCTKELIFRLAIQMAREGMRI